MELWKELDEIALQHDVNWKWVKAHNGNVHNEEADRLARKEAKKLKYRNYEIQKPLKKKRNFKLHRLKTVAT